MHCEGEWKAVLMVMKNHKKVRNIIERCDRYFVVTWKRWKTSLLKVLSVDKKEIP
jgi:hypothetical protein